MEAYNGRLEYVRLNPVRRAGSPYVKEEPQSLKSGSALATPPIISIGDGQASNSDPSILKDGDAPAFEIDSEIVEIC